MGVQNFVKILIDLYLGIARKVTMITIDYHVNREEYTETIFS